MPDRKRYERLASLGVLAAIVLGLYLSSLHSYLLFHSLVEIVTIAVAFTLFILTWNTRQYLANNYLKLLGIGYAFIAFIDLLHTLAYKGMPVFPGYGANLPTQLWIAARYLQAVTLLAAPLLVNRKFDNRAVFGGYAAAVSVLVAVVYSGHFPDCFIEGKGLTTFKIGSEYVISALLLAALYLLFRKREYFDDRVFLLAAASIACTVLSEISFTAYASVYGLANLVGHFAKLAAFYLIYRAILVTGLKDPFDLIFRNLTQAEEALQKARDNLEAQVGQRTAELNAANNELRMAGAYNRSLIEASLDPLVTIGPDGKITDVNGATEEATGLSRSELIGTDFSDYFTEPEKARAGYQEVFRTGLVRDYPLELQHRDGRVTAVFYNASVYRDERGEVSGVFAAARDITSRKKAEEALMRLSQRNELILNSAGEGIYGTDRDGNIMFIVPLWEG